MRITKMTNLGSSARSTVCSIVKDEKRSIVEWIAYQKCIGFDQVVVYDNLSSDGTTEILRSLSERGEIYFHIWPESSNENGTSLNAQELAYNDCLRRYSAEWMFFVDVDEFLCLKSSVSVNCFLAKFGVEVGAIAINWRVFGSSGHNEAGPRPVVERFTRAAKRSFQENKHIKSFARPTYTSRYGTHMAVLSKGMYVNAAGKQVSIIDYGKTEHTTFSEAQINHYVIKSAEEYREKILRGRAGLPSSDPEKFGKLTPQFFHHHDRNEVSDFNALRFRKNFRLQLKRLNSIVGNQSVLG